MLTRNGIAHNLNTSPYEHSVKYENTEVTFVFSSLLNKQRFINKLEDNRNYYNNSLSKRFNLEIECSIISDIKLYTLIEKRGSLLKVEGQKIEWLNNIKFVGMNLILKN